MHRLRTLDLFSGIGGIAKALEPYARTVVFCENDRRAQAALRGRDAFGAAVAGARLAWCGWT